jgi:hypothetical protein
VTASRNQFKLAQAWHIPIVRLLAWLLVTSACLSIPARAEGVKVNNARVEATEEGYQLSADFEMQLASTLVETVRKGVPVYFAIDVEVTRGRWYWLDDVVAKATRERRLGYAPLTQQFRLTTAGVSQNLSSPEDVLRALSRIRSWTIAERGAFKPGEKLQIAVRFRLDSAQLPKPFQLNTIGSREWNLSSDWQRWSVTVGREGGLQP